MTNTVVNSKDVQCESINISCYYVYIKHQMYFVQWIQWIHLVNPKMVIIVTDVRNVKYS